MSLTFTIATQLSFAFGKFLLKKYLKDDGVASTFDVLADIGQSKIQNVIERRAFARAAEGWADQVVSDLTSALDDEKKEHPELDVDAIGQELLNTLSCELAPGFFLAGDLDPNRVVAEYRERRPIPKNLVNLASDLAYERCLNHAVRSLLDIVSTLPKFQQQSIAETLRRLRNVDEMLAKIFAANRRIEREVKRVSTEGGSERFEVDYRKAVTANLDYIELFGITIPQELRRFQLTDAFISLNLQRSAAVKGKSKGIAATPGSSADDEEPDSEALDYQSALDLLRPGDGRLLIRGAAGCGKTTLLRKIAIEAAGLNNQIQVQLKSHDDFAPGESGENTPYSSVTDGESIDEIQDFVIDFPDNRRSWRGKIPFVILLRHCGDSKFPLAEEFPGLIGEGIGAPPADWVRSVLQVGEGLVLIDGVDEVPPSRRSEVERWLETLTKHYPESFFIVTTRPEAVPAGWLKSLGFREALVNPMGNADVEQFIRRWHEMAQMNLAAAGKPIDMSDKRQHLIDQLQENPALRPLSTYPLLCGSICALHLDRSGTLPESQSALCDAMCDALLHNREREQSGFDLQPFPATYRDLTVDQKRTLIQDLAVYMVEEGRSALRHDEACNRLAKKLDGFKDRSADDAREVLRGLLERSGLLREPVPNEVDFLHNTFKEFLAGEYFASERSIKKLMEHVLTAHADEDGTDGIETWRRVTLFAAGSRRAPETFGRDLITQLLSGTSESPAVKGKRRSKKEVLTDPLRKRHLLALQCQIVADGKGLSPELKGQLATLVKDLFPPRTLSDAESLSTLRDQAVPHLVRPKNKLQTAKAATNCVRALRLISSPIAIRAMEQYFDSEEPSVLNELSLAVDPLKLSAVRAAICSGYTYRIREVLRRIQSLDVLRNSREITQLELSESNVSDLTPLRELDSLTTLNLGGSQVTDLTPLKDLRTLASLGLSHTRVSDLEPLKELTALTMLFLDETDIWDLTPLEGLINLEFLDVSQSRLFDTVFNMENGKFITRSAKMGTDEFFVIESRHFELESPSSRLQLKDLRPLKNLSALTTLNLSGTQVSDLRPLKHLSALTTLNLSGTQVTDLKPLKHLSTLTSLNLSGTQVSDLTPLKDLSALTTLNLFGTQVSDLTSLKDLSALTTLNLPEAGVRNVKIVERPGLRLLRNGFTPFRST